MAKKFKSSLKKILNEEFNKYLISLSKGATSQIIKNIEKGVDINGNNFAPLQPSYELEKAKAGYGNKPILVRTGALKKSILISPDLANKRLRITSKDYGQYLNDGRSDMAPREILGMPTDWKEEGSQESKIFTIANDSLKSRVLDKIEELSKIIAKIGG